MSAARTWLLWMLGAALVLVPVTMVAVMYGLRPDGGCQDSTEAFGRQFLTWVAAVGAGALIALLLFAEAGWLAARAWPLRYVVACLSAACVVAAITVLAVVVVRTDPSCYI